MTRWSFATALGILLLGTAWGSAFAQVTETPVSFDSAGRVPALTPALVAGFGLVAPEWPASGSFRTARLYLVSTGGHVLAVERESGAIDRFVLADSQLAGLRNAIHAAMGRSGARVPGTSEPAGGAFVLNQMLVTWTLYGPLLASLTNDAKTGTVMYLAATGASYFLTSAINRKVTVTRAQNHLATDGAVRGAGAAAGALYAIAGENSYSDNAYATVALLGAVGGTITGFQLGKSRSSAEAVSTTTISTFAALTGLGVGGALGGFNETNDGHGVMGATVVAGLAGYIAGPHYPRRSRYRVTLGDVQVLWTGAILGAAVGAAPVAGDDVDEQTLFGSATAGMLAGTIIADRIMVSPFDYSTSDALQVHLGTAAGALIGGAAVVLTEPSDISTGVAIVTAGALLGAFAGHKMANPSRAGTRVGLLPEKPARRARVDFDALSATLAATRVPGRHAVLSFRF